MHCCDDDDHDHDESGAYVAHTDDHYRVDTTAMSPSEEVEAMMGEKAAVTPSRMTRLTLEEKRTIALLMLKPKKAGNTISLIPDLSKQRKNAKGYQVCCAVEDGVHCENIGASGGTGGKLLCFGHGGGKKRRCTGDGCSAISTFGVEDDGIAIFCKKCANKANENGDARVFVDVVHKRCAGDGCSAQPSFGVEDDGIAIFCKQCANKANENGDARVFVNVVHKRCSCGACDNVRASYILPSTGERVCGRRFRIEVPSGRVQVAVRIEHLVLGELICTMGDRLGITRDEFDSITQKWDCPLAFCGLWREPDMLYEFARFGLLIETDEDYHKYRTLRSELEHIAVILGHFEEKGKKLFVVRVGTEGIARIVYKGAPIDPPVMYRKKLRTREPLYVADDRFEEVVTNKLMDTLEPVFRIGIAGNLPDSLVCTNAHCILINYEGYMRRIEIEHPRTEAEKADVSRRCV